MRILLELNIEETDGAFPSERLSGMAARAMDAITGSGGPRVHPRLLVETSPNFIELPISYESVRAKSKM